uniref:Uncharacterized protein n=1 Tax=Caldimicrobium thiodismutans TaxID=1653476 RepID=A0A832GNW9_9BACT
MKIRLDLKGQVYIIFWGPVILLFVIILYTLLKQPVMYSHSGVSLPENYRKILEVIKVLEERKDPEPELDELAYLSNPFYTPPPQGSPQSAPREVITLTLTSILHLDRKSCIINQKLYKEGDRIGNIKIKKIGDYYVELEVPGKGRVWLEVGATYNFSE